MASFGSSFHSFIGISLFSLAAAAHRGWRMFRFTTGLLDRQRERANNAARAMALPIKQSYEKACGGLCRSARFAFP
jgi:hypothetical protein